MFTGSTTSEAVAAASTRRGCFRLRYTLICVHRSQTGRRGLVPIQFLSRLRLQGRAVDENLYRLLGDDGCLHLFMSPCLAVLLDVSHGVRFAHINIR